MSPHQPTRSRGPIFKVILALIGVFLLLGGLKAWQITTLISSGKKMVPPPSTVTSAKVEQADWAPMLTAVGSIAPVQGATISAELAGTVSEIGGTRDQSASATERRNPGRRKRR